MKLNRRALDKATEAVSSYVPSCHKRPIARKIVEAYLLSVHSQRDKLSEGGDEEAA